MWMLQPRNYMQAMRPNWYNVAYRRTGAYKGMGALGQGQCPGSPGCPGYVDPYNNLSTLMQGVLSGQNTIITTDAFNQLTAASVTHPSASTSTPWLLYGVIALVALGIMGARR